MNLYLSDKKNLKLYNNLSAITNDGAFYIRHGMRHPSKILVNKLNDVNVSIDALLLKRESHNFDPEKSKAIMDYLESINKLYDGLLLILKAITKPNEDDVDETDIKKWLQKNNHEMYTSFKDSTASEHSFIRSAANNIKHADLKVDYLELTNHKGKDVKGFYLSEIVSGDLSTPLTDIHKEYKGSATAFSYNHFLLRTAGVISIYFYHLNRIVFAKNLENEQTDKLFFNFFSKFENIEEIFFPDEYCIKYAKLTRKVNSLTILYPYRYNRKEKFHLIKSVRPTFETNQKVKYPYHKLIFKP